MNEATRLQKTHSPSRKMTLAPVGIEPVVPIDRMGRAAGPSKPERHTSGTILASHPPPRSATMRPEDLDAMAIPDDELRRLHAYFRAANYLTVGQIYLQSNPLLRDPLRPEHIKPRLLGHWGTSPGLNLIYAHVNRLIRERDVNAIFLAGPGHGGPAVLANVYLEGSYSELYPEVTEDTEGLRRLF